jgi:hypothetical protein
VINPVAPVERASTLALDRLMRSRPLAAKFNISLGASQPNTR